MDEIKQWDPNTPPHARLDDGAWLILAICPDCGDEQLFKSQAVSRRRWAEPVEYWCLACHAVVDVRVLRDPKTGEYFNWGGIVATRTENAGIGE